MDMEQQYQQQENSETLETFVLIIGDDKAYFTPAIFDRNVAVLSEWVERNIPGGLMSGGQLGTWELAFRACKARLTADKDYVSYAEQKAFLESLQVTPVMEQKRKHQTDAAYRRLWDLHEKKVF